VPRPANLCKGCGKQLREGRENCAACAVAGATQRLMDAARLGRVVAHSAEARSKQGQTQCRHATARSVWNATAQSAPLTAQMYSHSIQPLLATVSSSEIAKVLGVSRWYAGAIRKGHRPHPRHWLHLATLVGVFHSSAKMS
jgi:hypothetical protein